MVRYSFFSSDPVPTEPHFTHAELFALNVLLGPAVFAGQDHAGATYTLPSGENFRVSSTGIEPPRSLDHDWLRASMIYLMEKSGGRASIGVDPTLDVEMRLWGRAYAEVYGVEMDDINDCFLGTALRAAQLARLPAMRDQVRKLHADAPPQRPNETAWLAATYAQRFPYRGPPL